MESLVHNPKAPNPRYSHNLLASTLKMKISLNLSEGLDNYTNNKLKNTTM
jgi:hypothetical protein